MTANAPFRWLLVEDDPDWRKLIERAAGSTMPFYRHARTREEAARSLSMRPIHLVSIDQNFPDRAGESSASANGLGLLGSVVTSCPFVRTVIYTAYGEIPLAHKAGRLGDTEYVQKAVGTNNTTALTPRDYIGLLRVLLEGGTRGDRSLTENSESEAGYVLWALRRGQRHLPPVLALDCEYAFRNGDTPVDWTHIATSLFHLREHGIYLAWAQAAAICAAIGLKTHLREYFDARTITETETHLRKMWIALDETGHLGSWKPYITEQNDNDTWGEPGVAFINGVRPLRDKRNEISHGAHFSKADFDAQLPALLALIDALAYWADRPLMAAPRIHPDDPRRLQFSKVVGSGQFSSADTPVLRGALPGSAESRRLRIYAMHETEAFGQRAAERLLVDLYPLISLKEVSGRTPMPCLLKPSPSGRGLVRVSLEDFKEVPIPLDAEEKSALRSKFGYG